MLMSKNYVSIKELQADLDEYLNFLQFARKNQDSKLKGSDLA
jgi:hypothetical protein